LFISNTIFLCKKQNSNFYEKNIAILLDKNYIDDLGKNKKEVTIQLVLKKHSYEQF
jgi:hypothetical protein